MTDDRKKKKLGIIRRGTKKSKRTGLGKIMRVRKGGGFASSFGGRAMSAVRKVF